MSSEEVQRLLADAISLLSFTEKILSQYPQRDLVLARKNIRDALAYVRRAKAEIDSWIKDIDIDVGDLYE